MASVHDQDEVAAALEAVAETGFNEDFSNFIFFLGAVKITPTNRNDLENEIWTWEDGSGTFTSKEYRDNGLFNVAEPFGGASSPYLGMFVKWVPGELLDLPEIEGGQPNRRPALYTCCSELLDQGSFMVGGLEDDDNEQTLPEDGDCRVASTDSISNNILSP